MEDLLLRRHGIIAASFNSGPYVPTEHTATFRPVSDVSQWGSRDKVDNISYGYRNTSSSSTFFAKFNLNEVEYDGAQVVYIFRDLNIPSGAVIKSVQCDVKASVNNSSKVEMLFELWKYPPSDSSTPVGRSATITSTSATIKNIGRGGSWTPYELNQNVYLWVAATRQDSPASGTAYGRFYGADLNITYEY